MSTTNATKEHCPLCNINRGENKILLYLQKHSISFEPQKKFDDLLGLKGGKLSYDFYLPEYNTLIEYQGEQHEHPITQFGGEQQFVVQKEHDKLKKEYAEKHNINLLEIWYRDFSRLEQILDENLK